MRVKLPWILLAGSVLLNAFFLGGVVYSKMTAEQLRDEPGARFDFVAEELGLTESERQRFRELRDALGAQRADMRAQGAPLRAALFAEMRKPALDRNRVDELMRERSAQFAGRFARVMGELHAYLGGLSPEKKEKFLAMMEREHRFLWRMMRGPRDGADRPQP